MPWSLSNNILTQTGTDTSLASLANIAAIDVVGTSATGVNAGHVVYDVGNRRIIVNGNLTINGNVETLITNANKNNNGDIGPFRVNGTLNVGVQATDNGVTRFTGGTPIITTNDGAGNFAFSVGSNGTLNVNGGTIRVSGMVEFDNGCFVNWNNGTCFCSSLLANGGPSDRQFRINSTSVANNARVNFNDCILDSQDYVFSIFTTSGIGTAGFTLRRSAFLNFVNAQPDLTFAGFNNSENAAVADYIARTNTVQNVSLVNFDDCSRRVRYLQEDGGRNGYARTRRNMNFEFIDVNQNPITRVSHYSIDTNNGSRGTIAGFNDTADIIYAGQDQTAPFFETILVETYRVNENNDIEFIDDRTDADGTIIKRAITYAHQIAAIRPIMFGENVAGTTTTTMLPDFSIVETSESMALGFTAQDTPEKAYDHLKAVLVRDYLGEQVTTASRVGSLLDLGSRDVIVDGTNGGGEAIVTESSVTIFAANFVGDITTTGNVTNINGSIVTGVITDESGQRANVVITVNNVIVGSRILIEAVDVGPLPTGQIILNTESVSSTASIPFSFTQNQPVRVRVRNASAAPFYANFETMGVITESGLIVTANQQLDQ